MLGIFYSQVSRQIDVKQEIEKKSTLEYEAGFIMHTEGYFAILGSRKESTLMEFYSFITFSKTHLNVFLIEFHD